MHKGLALAVLLALPGPLGAPGADAAHDEAPAPWWERTLLDRDGDGLDDALARLPVDGETADVPVTVLLDYARMPTPSQRAAVEASGARIVTEYVHFPMLVVEADAARVPELAALPGVVLVEQNDRVSRLLKDSVPLIGAPLAWGRYDTLGEKIVVAILDDGTYEQHPDFEEKIVASYDASAPPSPLLGSRSSDVVTPAGEKGHATHVAGTVVGTGGESNGVYKGVAPAARFANVKVFSGPNQTSSDVVLRGLDWVLTNRDRLDVRVVQLSLGGRVSDGTDALSRAVDIVVDDGLVVVAAAGNAGPGESTVTSPGSAAKAITVGAVDKRKNAASFSSRGPTLDGRTKPDLVAPGVAIVSTIPPTSTTGVDALLSGRDTLYYGSLSGTSMAAPHVAGTAALMLAVNPDLTPIQVKRILLATAQDLAAEGADNTTGYGFVNAVASVQVAREPSLLNSPALQRVVATIPDPPRESMLERLAYEMESLARTGEWVVYALAFLVGAVAVSGVAVAVRRRRP